MIRLQIRQCDRGETFLLRHHYLLTPDAELSDVKRVFAHPQALMQSSDFLNQHDWQQLSMENNAVAQAQKVRDEKDPSQAAVAGEVAGEIYRPVSWQVRSTTVRTIRPVS